MDNAALFNVDISSIPITREGIIDGYTIFKVETSRVKPLAACIFRGELVAFLARMAKDWHLGNDDRFIQFSPHDLTLALRHEDAKKFISYGWLV